MSTRSNNPTAFWLATLVTTMVVLSFASVPFYSWFCKVTGYAGTTNTATKGSDVVLAQTVNIRFDGSVTSELPWDFRPVVNTMTLKLGETGMAYFEAHNYGPTRVAGTATFNVLPYDAGPYFDKIDCFCFNIQVLEPGETVLMPVTFFVDPEILNESELPVLPEITLSYTFSMTDLPDEQVSLEPELAIPDKTNVN
jgi:cytochrome c oxidase assembly protein subunit 11